EVLSHLLDPVVRGHQQSQRMRIGEERLAAGEELRQRHMRVAHRGRIVAFLPGPERIGNEGSVLEQLRAGDLGPRNGAVEIEMNAAFLFVAPAPAPGTRILTLGYRRGA